MVAMRKTTRFRTHVQLNFFHLSDVRNHNLEYCRVIMNTLYTYNYLAVLLVKISLEHTINK